MSPTRYHYATLLSQPFSSFCIYIEPYLNEVSIPNHENICNLIKSTFDKLQTLNHAMNNQNQNSKQNISINKNNQTSLSSRQINKQIISILSYFSAKQRYTRKMTKFVRITHCTKQYDKFPKIQIASSQKPLPTHPTNSHQKLDQINQFPVIAHITLKSKINLGLPNPPTNSQLFNDYKYNIYMQLFKKVLGFGTNDLKSTAEQTKIDGTLYRVIKDTRNIIFTTCTITFQLTDKPLILFQSNQNSEGTKSYAFPIHSQMNLVSFNMKKNDKTHRCFEWNLDDAGDHVGCYMDPKDKQKFNDVICRILKSVLNDDNIKDHLKLCKQLSGIPVYKTNEQAESAIGSGISKKNSVKSEKNLQINDILVKQALKQQNRMVHTASYYQIIDKQRNLVQDPVVFILKTQGNFQFEFQLLNATGYAILRKQLTPNLIYQVNTDLGYIKWLHLEDSCKVIEVNFESKRDIAMSLQFAIVQCLYEYNNKKSLKDQIAQDQLTYINTPASQPFNLSNPKLVKTYQNQQEQLQLTQPKFIYGNSQVEKGLDKYRVFCQAKINNFDVASLGAILETLKISEDNQIVGVSKRKVVNLEGRNIYVQKIVLHDKDKKAMLKDENGQLHYYDMQKGNIIRSYNLSPKGIQDICPEYKLAETSDYNTFKAVSLNTIYEVDPRLEKGSQNSKSYQTTPDFNNISVDCKGRFAASSTTGQIKLFDGIGKNANCKYAGLGDPVLHLQSTKDGKWLLATFKTYLLLIPTQTDDQLSLYQKKIKINQRPRPIKLSIKLEHLQLCKIDTLQLIPAKFDERKGIQQMYIVSGFGQYLVIWNMAQVIRGETHNYKFTSINGSLLQTEFMFNNVKKLIMTTNSGIVIKQNKIKK